MAICGGFAAANLKQWSIKNIANSSTCLNIFRSSSKANEKTELEKNSEFSDNELMFYDNFQRNCQSSIKKESKVGFWETFIIYSVISLIGLNIARALKE